MMFPPKNKTIEGSDTESSTWCRLYLTFELRLYSWGKKNPDGRTRHRSAVWVYASIEGLPLHLVHELFLRLTPANPINPVAIKIMVTEPESGFDDDGSVALSISIGGMTASNRGGGNNPIWALSALECMPPSNVNAIKNMSSDFLIMVTRQY